MVARFGSVWRKLVVYRGLLYFGVVVVVYALL